MSSSLGDDANTGTKAKPVKTLGAALALAKGWPVHACGESFVESVSIGQSVTLYGGLACAKGWTYDAQKTTLLTAKADPVPKTVNKSTNVEVSDFAITSADAVNEGGSNKGRGDMETGEVKKRKRASRGGSKPHVAVRLRPEDLARLEALRPHMSEAWHDATLSDVLRAALLRGLRLLEQEYQLGKEAPAKEVSSDSDDDDSDDSDGSDTMT